MADNLDIIGKIQADGEKTYQHRKDFDTKEKNLLGIFAKLEGKLDIKKYLTKLNKIKTDMAIDPDVKREIPDSTMTMQLEVERFAYLKYIKRLDDLTREVEKDLMPFYELYLLAEKIDLQVKDISGENIGEVIKNARDLIDALNDLNIIDDDYKKQIVNQAYKTIYSVILYEELFDRNDIITYIIRLNNDALRENLGRLLTKDLQSLDKQLLIDEDLKSLKNEGLGYDFLTQDFIRKISRNTVGQANSEYQERKRRTIDELTRKVTNFDQEKKDFITYYADNKKAITILYFKKAFTLLRIVALLLIPVTAFNIGKSTGKKESDKILLYETTTRTVNLDTGEIIGEPKVTYDEKETTYVATVLVNGPWRKNPASIDYIHDVTAYEYIAPENIEEDYHATKEDLEGHTFEKYSYVEPKDVLEDNDSTTEYTILITETYQNKNHYTPSTKYIIPFAIGGAALGLLIDFILALIGICHPSKIADMIAQLNKEIKEKKLSNEEIKDRLNKMIAGAELLCDEYNAAVVKYGNIGDQLILPDTIKISGDQRKRKRN